ncbi:unnamed protein product [Sphagnum jensenii]|uniref:Uncharacterized protein n=2 Tax=Sphagnum jensenii TaxID=128206 RepID=A0ABP0V862_9BRYO
MVSSVPTVFPAFNATEWAAGGGFYQVGAPGHAYLGESAIYSPFSSRNRCEAEGGGIVWESLVLRSGACMHKGLCLSSIMRCKRPRKVEE